MSRKAIASLASNSSNVGDVVYILKQLEDMAPDHSIVNVEMQSDGDVGAGTLFEEVLTDGSTVYTVQLR